MKKVFDTAYNMYKGLPLYGKVAIGLAGVLAAYGLGKGIISRFSRNRQKMIQESNEASKRLAELYRQGIKPSFPKAQYESWSNKIVVAINDCGTDEKAIFSIFESIKNEADLMSLVSAFGIRKYKGCGSAYFGMEERSLSGALNDDLSSGEIAKINSILEAKKINFKF